MRVGEKERERACERESDGQRRGARERESKRGRTTKGCIPTRQIGLVFNFVHCIWIKTKTAEDQFVKHRSCISSTYPTCPSYDSAAVVHTPPSLIHMLLHFMIKLKHIKYHKLARLQTYLQYRSLTSPALIFARALSLDELGYFDTQASFASAL